MTGKADSGRVLGFGRELARRYSRHDVGHQSAALAYYLLFTLFPLMIFFSALLGLLQLNVSDVLSVLSTVLPGAVVDLCEAYLVHISATSSATMMWFALVFSVYFPVRAANCLMRGVRRAYGLEPPERPLRYYGKVLLFTGILLVGIVAALVLMTFGQRLLLYLAGRTRFTQQLIYVWNYLRFLLLAFLLFAMLGLLYAMAQDRRRAPIMAVLPGTLAALGGWMLLSVGFSYYVENFADYSLIYGTLGTVVVLLIWLYLSSVMLLMGAECNGAYRKRKTERELREGENG